MNDFWEWMEEKKYGERELVGANTYYWLFQHQRHSNCSVSIKSTNQMLIGYMMEYLREVKGKIILNTGGRATINDVYDRYIKDIDKIERENLFKRMVGDNDKRKN